MKEDWSKVITWIKYFVMEYMEKIHEIKVMKNFLSYFKLLFLSEHFLT